MLFLDQLFGVHLNKQMTLQILNIIETENILLNLVKGRCLAKITCLEIPEILKCEFGILSQFYFVYYPLDIYANRIAFYFFKKTWDLENKKFLPNLGLCQKSFIIDFNLICEPIKNWKNIIEGKFKTDELQIYELEEHNIRMEDYTSYIELFRNPQKNNFIPNNFWGETISPLNIDWIITIEGIIKKCYGGTYDEDDIPDFFTFKHKTLHQIYYPNSEISNTLYHYLEQFSRYKCDWCHNYFAKNQKEKNVWHNSNYGDICNTCYLKIKNDYFIKLNQNRKNILLRARKRMFRFEVNLNRRMLDQINLPKLSLEKKYSIHQKVLREIMRDKKEAHCSICLDVLDNNIKAGSCGHCFHSSCLNNLVGSKCPVCRTNTDFIKLHL